MRSKLEIFDEIVSVYSAFAEMYRVPNEVTTQQGAADDTPGTQRGDGDESESP